MEVCGGGERCGVWSVGEVRGVVCGGVVCGGVRCTDGAQAGAGILSQQSHRGGRGCDCSQSSFEWLQSTDSHGRAQTPAGGRRSRGRELPGHLGSDRAVTNWFTTSQEIKY